MSQTILRLKCYNVPFYIKTKYIYSNFTVSCEKSKTYSFVSSIIKNIVVFPALSKFQVICCFAFGSALSYCCLLKSIAIIL